MNPDNAWYVVQSRPRQELLAAAAIEARLCLTVFLPEIQETRQEGCQRIPLFPGYLFVEATTEGVPAHSLNKTPGVLRLVAFDGEMRPVDPTVVSALRERCAAIDEQGGLPEHRFHPGDWVRLTDGPLAGLEGVFQGPMTAASRVEVLLHFLGREQTTRVPVHDLEPAANPAPDRPRRRTRGRGRRIRRQENRRIPTS